MPQPQNNADGRTRCTPRGSRLPAVLAFDLLRITTLLYDGVGTTPREPRREDGTLIWGTGQQG